MAGGVSDPDREDVGAAGGRDIPHRYDGHRDQRPARGGHRGLG